MTSRAPDLPAAAMQALFLEAALAAGREIMAVFDGNVLVDRKSDDSPVTVADRNAETVIARILTEAHPGIPLVAEEAICDGHVPPDLGSTFFLVDPLDGTKEFIAGLKDFTVNIALIEDGVPVGGVVFAPAWGEMFGGFRSGALRWTMTAGGTLGDPVPIRTRLWPDRPLAVASRSHRTPATDAFLAGFELEAVLPVGSSLKFCRLAEGKADLYPCLGRTMEWDTAAGDAVLRAAGGKVARPDGSALRYGKRQQEVDVDFANPQFIATGDPAHGWVPHLP